MPSNELLGVYLNDHLAGSSAGLELAEKLRDNNQGTALGDVMAGLHLEIEQDRKTLEELMERLEVTRHPVKDAAGWVLERLSRLRLNPALTGSAELTRLLETEVLSLGIEGKLAMWLALKEAAAERPAAGRDRLRPADRAGPRPAPHAGAPPGGGGGAVVRELSGRAAAAAVRRTAPPRTGRRPRRCRAPRRCPGSRGARRGRPGARRASPVAGVDGAGAAPARPPSPGGPRRPGRRTRCRRSCPGSATPVAVAVLGVALEQRAGGAAAQEPVEAAQADHRAGVGVGAHVLAGDADDQVVGVVVVEVGGAEGRPEPVAGLAGAGGRGEGPGDALGQQRVGGGEQVDGSN